MRTVTHHITIETRPGRTPTPVKQRWSCTCGAGTTGWKLKRDVQRQVAEHEVKP